LRVHPGNLIARCSIADGYTAKTTTQRIEPNKRAIEIAQAPSNVELYRSSRVAFLS